MGWPLVVLIGMGMVSFLGFMGMIIFGNRKTVEYEELEKTLDKKAKDHDLDAKELWKALKKSEEEKEQILKRLKNLETIVTSEAYEAIKSGEEPEKIQLHIEEEETEELNDSDKAAKISKRVR